MISISDFIKGFHGSIPGSENLKPWDITMQINKFILAILSGVQSDYIIKNGVALHNSAIIEEGAVIKGPAVISDACFIGAGAYLRDGVFLGPNVSIGPGCEIKSSILFNGTRIAHFNFIGDSLIGNDVNFEAGAVIANHYNERNDKIIQVKYKSELISTGIEKFGALVGDHSRIGANSVLSPGTILNKNSIVKRLELVEQIRK